MVASVATKGGKVKTQRHRNENNEYALQCNLVFVSKLEIVVCEMIITPQNHVMI